LKDYWFLNAAIALTVGCFLGLLINPGASLLLGLSYALISGGSFWIVNRIDKLRQDRKGKSLQASVNNLHQRAQALQQNVLVGEEQRSRLQLEIASHQKQVTALENARRRIAGEYGVLEAQMLALQAEKAELEASIDRPQIAANKAVNDLEQKNRSKDRVTARQETLAALAAEIAERKIEHKQLTAEVKRIQAEHKSALAQYEKLQPQLKTQQTQEQELQQSLQHLQAQVTQLSIVQKQVTELHQEREQLQESITWLCTDRDQIIGQSQYQVQELLDREQELQRSVKELQQEAAKFEQTQERVDTLYREWQQLEDSVAEIAAKKATQEAALADDLAAIAAQKAAQEAALADDLAAIAAQKAAQAAAQEADLVAIAAQKAAQAAAQEADLVAIAARKADQAATLEADLAEIANQKAAQEAELAEITTQRIAKEADLAAILAQKAVYEAELAAMQPQIQTVQQSHEQLIAEVAELRLQKERLTRSQEQAVFAAESALPAVAETPWQERFEDEKIRAVFEHLDEYGSLTEVELTQMLEGNPRKARQFALKFDEYLTQVPFAARVEVGATGKRYVRN
jgi:chromosome segregation ATPase